MTTSSKRLNGAFTEKSEHGHFIVNHSINPRHDQGGVQCDGEVSMSKEVTEIINTLCEKLGVVASALVPELAKYNIARLAFLTVIQAVIAIVVALIVTKLVKIAMSDDEMDLEEKCFALFLINIIPVIILAVFVGCTILSATNLIGWIASPTASAVKEIVSMIR